MHVAVCIVGFRNSDDIVRCLSALEALTHGGFAVVICENGGAEAARALRMLLPGALAGGQPVSVVDAGGNLGYAGGFNRCIAEAPAADAWWLLNPDTRPEPGALAAMLARLARGDCEATGGTLLLGNGRVQAYGGRFRSWLARAESIGHGSAYDPSVDAASIERATDYVLGASMLVTRTFVERVGPMRDDYFLYAEEVEWGVRARRRGMKLGCAPDAIVHHDQGSTTGSGHAAQGRARLPVYLDTRNLIHVVRDLMPARLPIAIIATFLLIFLRYARRGAWRQTGYALGGLWAGVRNERGLPHFMR